MKILRFIALFCCLPLLLSNTVAMAAGVPTPQELPGGEIIGLQESKALVDNGAHVFDVRSAINYGRGHIPGAILTPYKGKSAKQVDFDPALDRFPLNRLPGDPGADLLFYSHGDTGWKSYKAAVTAIRAGYTRVKWLRSGYSSWTAAGLPVDQ